jgi:hypothetical protein
MNDRNQEVRIENAAFGEKEIIDRITAHDGLLQA